MNTQDEKLKAKVAAMNKGYAYAEKLWPQLIDIFTPFVGKQVFKSGGGLLAKIEKLLPDFKDDTIHNVYRYSSDYSLMWNVKTCEFMPPHSCMYNEVSVYVAEVRNGIIQSMYTKEKAAEHFSKRFTFEAVKEQRLLIKEARKVLDDLKGKLYPFEEFYT